MITRPHDEERWTDHQKWLVALVAMTIVFDGVDNQLLGFVSERRSARWCAGGVPVARRRTPTAAFAGDTPSAGRHNWRVMRALICAVAGA